MTARGFYFSLPRLCNAICGRDAPRVENNLFEASLVGISMYILHYLFFAVRFVPANAGLALKLFGLLALLFWTFAFWLLALHVNSLIIKFLRVCGLWHKLPDRRAQSVLLGILTTAIACDFLRRGFWLRGLGSAWVIIAAANLASAFVLALKDGFSRRTE